MIRAGEPAAALAWPGPARADCCGPPVTVGGGQAQHHDARVRAARRLLAAVCSGLPRKQPEGRQRGRRAVTVHPHTAYTLWHFSSI